MSPDGGIVEGHRRAHWRRDSRIAATSSMARSRSSFTTMWSASARPARSSSGPRPGGGRSVLAVAPAPQPRLLGLAGRAPDEDHDASGCRARTWPAPWTSISSSTSWPARRLGPRACRTGCRTPRPTPGTRRGDWASNASRSTKTYASAGSPARRRGRVVHDRLSHSSGIRRQRADRRSDPLPTPQGPAMTTISGRSGSRRGNALSSDSRCWAPRPLHPPGLG